MKVLLIGGTGTISTAITKQLAETEHEVYLLNRGNRNSDLPANIKFIQADINNEAEAAEKLKDMSFDCVCEFIGFVTAQVERDYRLFKGKTKQYIYISSASAYHKPVKDYRITEATTLANPYWEYSRNKIASEEFLFKMYRENGFPVTIVRPSHTYCERSVPMGVHGNNGSWQVLKRMLEGKQVIVHGDGIGGVGGDAEHPQFARGGLDVHIVEAGAAQGNGLHAQLMEPVHNFFVHIIVDENADGIIACGQGNGIGVQLGLEELQLQIGACGELLEAGNVIGLGIKKCNLHIHDSFHLLR